MTQSIERANQVVVGLNPVAITFNLLNLIRYNQQTFENESRIKVWKRELKVMSQNNILKCEADLEMHLQQPMHNYQHLSIAIITWLI